MQHLIGSKIEWVFKGVKELLADQCCQAIMKKNEPDRYFTYWQKSTDLHDPTIQSMISVSVYSISIQFSA